MLQAQAKSQRIILVLSVCSILAGATLALSSCSELSDQNSGGSNIEGPPRDTTPVVLQVSQPGIAVVADERAVLDYSNAAEGYICVMSYSEMRVKVLVYFGDAEYQYTIEGPGYYITIPLSEGDGLYSVNVYENIIEDRYSPIFSQLLDVVIADEYKPFLYPNQYVNFAAGDEAMGLSQQLAQGSVTDVDALNSIYNWVCLNIEYDMDKAVMVVSTPGYLSDNTDTIATETGICLDYAVLTTSMLRAQSVPCKLVVGYAGQAYHAWLEVHCVETGKVLSYQFDGTKWVRMDPTFDSAADGSAELSAVIGNGTDYYPMLYY